MTNPQAGWYDDGSGRTRWWDGNTWTEHFAPEPASAPAASAASAAIEEIDEETTLRQPVAVASASSWTPTSVATSEAVHLSPTSAPQVASVAVVPPTATIAPPPVAPVGYGVPSASAALVGAVSMPKNVLGIIAFVVAIIGFIFACVPGAFIIGWILLPVAFVLSIVALFLKGGKGLAITGLILSIVGTIVGFVVFFAFVGNSFQQAFGSDTSVDSDSAADAPAVEIPADEPTDASGEVGTRDNPAALGATITGKDFDVVINGIQFNQNDAVLAANTFNQEPPAGTAYAVVNATITYKGEDSGFAAYVGIDFVTAAGNVVNSSDTFAVAPDPAFGLDELYKGASSTGNVVLAIPTDGAGLIRVRPGMLADEVFVSIK